jgi:hypothetical protein
MAKKRMSLPANIALTDRSRKFYDGTYTLVSDGFKDEKGGKCALRTLMWIPRMYADMNSVS